jgi:hypothetical protein
MEEMAVISAGFSCENGHVNREHGYEPSNFGSIFGKEAEEIFSSSFQ